MINADKVQKWKDDVAKSVDFYNSWGSVAKLKNKCLISILK